MPSKIKSYDVNTDVTQIEQVQKETDWKLPQRFHFFREFQY